MGEKTPDDAKWHRVTVLVVWGLCAMLLVTLAWLWARERGWIGSGPVESFTPQSRLANPVEINTATATDLQHVRGIGEKRAQEIIFKRDELIHGQRAKKIKPVGFRNIDDFIASIQSVSGFKEIENELRASIRVQPLPK